MSQSLLGGGGCRYRIRPLGRALPAGVCVSDGADLVWHRNNPGDFLGWRARVLILGDVIFGAASSRDRPHIGVELFNSSSGSAAFCLRAASKLCCYSIPQREKGGAKLMSSLPTGTVTFLFTDIEGSTKFWERSPEAMQRALARHDQILRNAVEGHAGYVFKTVGDAFCCAFATAPDALEVSLFSQRALLSREGWPEETGPLLVRMALHAGAAEERDGDYFGPPVNRVARLLSAGHGGQVLLSLTAQELVRDQLPPDVELSYLGEHRLKDLFRPERVFQLVAPDLPVEFPSLKTLERYPNNLPLQLTPLIGREREIDEVCRRLRSPEVRVLTLTGPGGAGKTRLGLQVGAELLDEFEDGVFFVALAPLTDPALVASAIASPLGVVETGERPLKEGLETYLRDKELLLLLDNFEQVLD